RGPERIALLGPNGSGKTTLLKRQAMAEWPDGPRWPRTLRSRRVHPLPGLTDLIRVGLRGGWTRREVSDAGLLPIHPTDLQPVLAGEVAATWIGHSSWLVRTATQSVLIDPVLSRHIRGVRPRLTPPGLTFAELPPVNVLLISHDPHSDHLDWPTVTRLDRRITVLVPAKLGKGFRRRGFQDVRELDWWDEVRLDDLIFTCLPAAHWSGRTPLGLWRTLWACWMITTASGQRIYHAGDSAYALHFQEIGARYGHIDLALMPVGSYSPQAIQAFAHMNPGEAVRACGDLRASRMALMHWATFVLSDEPLLEPMRLSMHAWRRAERPPADLWPLAVGETRILPTAPPVHSHDARAEPDQLAPPEDALALTRPGGIAETAPPIASPPRSATTVPTSRTGAPREVPS
ncbi:MBL fold metallo-hydrolase, partial [Nonomuraea sp. NPDC049784]|uniref:MBL fold metallo-hydrolase n=1 Tax=Nonomuraea sp. NPDC049784 TaxID=3154361 RepID=UPI0033F60CE7